MADKSISTATLFTSPGIYTVPASVEFLSAVAQGILQGAKTDKQTLAEFTVVVPDRETGQRLRDAFVQEQGGRTLILPHIISLSELEEESLGLKVSGDPALAKTLLDLPPPVSRLRRQLLLAQEILKIPGMASSPEKAVKLGGELGKFLDQAQHHLVDLTKLDQLVPPAFKAEWEKTAAFLKIITDIWPQKLQEMGMSDPVAHRNSLLRIQTAHWRKNGSMGNSPVIAAGFVSTTPAITDLLGAIASLPQGQIILPGLDIEVDQESWDATTLVHPQHALKTFLESLGVTRDKVLVWKNGKTVSDRATAVATARESLLREAMRPGTAMAAPLPQRKKSPMTKSGKKTKTNKKKPSIVSGPVDPRALSGLDFVTCGSQQEEASVIALRLREVLETQGRTGMLVTSDRALAKRVSTRLHRWGIHVPDSAGQTLAETGVGILLLSAAAMAAQEWAPVPFLETLKHSLTALGENEIVFHKLVEEIEEMALRGARPAPGAAGLRASLRAAFNNPARPKQKSSELQDFVNKIEDAGRPFFNLMSKDIPQPFSDILDAHIRFVENLASSDKESGAARLWRGSDAVTVARFLSSLRDMAQFVPPVTRDGYVDVLRALMSEMQAPSQTSSHPSLIVTSPARAHLLKADVVILGGINDESWPPRPDENPWLSPDMMKSLGMGSAEQFIGNSAHAFVELSCASNVLLTRAVRANGTPTVPSPFLMRLLTALRAFGLEDALVEKNRLLLDINKAMCTPPAVIPIDPPAPTPPVEFRPREVSATGIEMLMRDPYSFYVKYILKLKGKMPLDARPSQAERGRFVHAALDAFMKKYPKDLPDTADTDLLKIGADIFQKRMASPSVRAFWWPRFERIAKWFVTLERERRKACVALGTEVRGKLQIDMGDGTTFTLIAIADRIDLNEKGILDILDYKTGDIPQPKDTVLGFSPQLTLEALIAFSGGFDKIDAKDVGSLQYWKLSGGRPGGKISVVNADVKELVEKARVGLENLAKTFNKKSTPYLVTPRPDFAPRYNNTVHLSRKDEWDKVKKVVRRNRPPQEKPKKKKGSR